MSAVPSVKRGVPAFGAFLFMIAACAPAYTTPRTETQSAAPPISWPAPPSPDPRVGLRAGVFDAGEAVWNLRVLSKTPPAPEFRGNVNSDLAFSGNYAIQGNFGGYQFWDLTNPASPRLAKAFVCPASQSDVSVYRNLLFVSGEDYAARLDCGTQGIADTVSTQRMRGIRIFDISDVANPRPITTVQTCRGSHTHTVLADPRDPANIYIYVSGSAPVRPAGELTGCSALDPERDPNSSLFRIEVIRVPLANPSQAAIVNSPRIFTGLGPPPAHAPSKAMADSARAIAERARAAGHYVVEVQGQVVEVPPNFVAAQLAAIVRARGGAGAPTAADSTALRASIQGIVNQMVGESGDTGPTQCHDITVYPEIGLAGGACEGYGLLLDISDPANPRRVAAAADSNFAYWHSATFNNDGTKVLFTDEWGGGSAARCRASDRPEWGANAIFTIENRELTFRSYFKIPAAQTEMENCVAHNGSLIPVPGRDIMVQSWYQGGISVFDWTDASNAREIAFFDRGPLDGGALQMAGSWSVYWYNGLIVSSEIARGLDVLELTPSAYLSQNEIDAAKSVRQEYFNPQQQPKIVWPPTFALARAYIDQLERSRGLSADRISSLRSALTGAERANASERRSTLMRLSTEVQRDARGADANRVRLLSAALGDLGNAQQ